MNIEPYRDEVPPFRQCAPGGAWLLSKPIPGAHSVALGVWLKTGSEHEPSELNGLSHFLEHIVFKGSTRRSAFEIADAFDRLGAAVDAFTTKDHVAFTVKVLPEYLEPAVEILADMLQHPAFDPQMVALEQDVVCEEIQEARDNPEDYLHDAFAAHVYGIHPRGRPILGTSESVRALTNGELRRRHRQLFSGSNVVIAMAGNLQGHSRQIVLENFALPDPPAPDASLAPALEPRHPVGPPLPGDGNGRLDLKDPIVQTYFEIGNLAVSFTHPDRVPLFVLSSILGGGMSSRIFQAVREREGLAYTVYTYSDMGRDVGLVSCAGACSPEKTARLEDIVRQEYARLIRDGVSEEELASNRAQIKSQLIFSLEGVTNQMYRIAKNEILYGRFIPVTELVEQIDSVDQDRIIRCAEQYFNPERVFVATHGPGPSAEVG